MISHSASRLAPTESVGEPSLASSYRVNGPWMVRPTAGRSRIRVLYCADNLEIGGTELNAVRTAERLDRTRIDLRVVCLRAHGTLAARYRQAGIPVHHFPITSLYAATTFRQGIRFARYLAREQIDVMHSHDMYSNVFATACARIARVPVIIASRRWSHLLPQRVHRIANAVAYRFADRVLANSEAVARSLQDSEGVRPERIAVVSNFVDEAAFTPPAPAARAALLAGMGVPAGARVAGIVARLNPVKDHATLLQAFAELAPRWSDLHLVIVGDGACRGALEARAVSLGIAHRVHFAGERSNEPNLHHLFDLSVLCSISEGFPNSIVEAMAAGRPVVATAVGGTVDAVAHDVTGLLVPPSSPAALAAAIDSLLTDPARARALGTAGARAARDRYFASDVVHSLEALYEDLVACAVRPRRGVGR